LLKSVVTFYQELPSTVKRVLLRGLLLWFVFSVSYYYIFLPHGKMVKAFTHITSISTVWVLNNYYSEGFVMGSPTTLGEIIQLGKRNILYIMDTCSGFKLFVLYLGFLICAPGKVKSKLLYSFTGVILIYILNILRCCAIAILVLQKPHWTYFAHHYIFTIIVYSAIFFLWLSFLKIKKSSAL